MTEILKAAVAEVPHWHHSIDLGHGVITPGLKSPECLRREWKAMQLPDLRGLDVLDVGAWDGWFSFEAERHGAARVVSLDFYMWCVDWSRLDEYKAACFAAGTPQKPWHEATHDVWRPDTMPGKRGYDLAHRRLLSRAEVHAGGMTTMYGNKFDVVFLLGVLYHGTDPFGTLQNACRSTKPGGLCVIETEAFEADGTGDDPLFRFFPFDEYNDDPTTYFVPNRAALAALALSAGFSRVDALTPKPAAAGHYRCFAHATR